MTKETLELFQSYISKCDEVLKTSNVESACRLETSIVSIFNQMIPDLNLNLTTNTSWILADDYAGDNTDYLFNVELLKEKLEFHFKTKGANMNNNQKIIDRSIKIENGIHGSGNSINTNSNTNTVNNTIDFKVALAKVREQLENDEVLDDEVKEEIHAKLTEVESVMEDNPSGNEKWKKLKCIVNWATTKGYRVGKIVMPFLINTMFPETQITEV